MNKYRYIFIKKKSNIGFTLLELLLAVVLFSIIVVAIYTSLAMGIKIHNKSNELSGKYADMQSSFERIAQDLRMAVSISNIYLVESSSSLYFYSCQYSQGSTREIFKINYQWKRDGDYYDLFRLKETYINSVQGTHKSGEELLNGILNFSFEYGYIKDGLMDEKKFIWKNGWTEEILPKMVKVNLKFTNDEFEKVIYCPAGKLGEIKEE